MSEPGGPREAREARETPPLVLVRGNASAEEIAALIAVLTAKRAAAARQAAPPPSVSLWGSPAAKLRKPPRHGPGAWRSSARPG